jgi:hypothetical protein
MNAFPCEKRLSPTLIKDKVAEVLDSQILPPQFNPPLRHQSHAPHGGTLCSNSSQIRQIIRFHANSEYESYGGEVLCIPGMLEDRAGFPLVANLEGGAAETQCSMINFHFHRASCREILCAANSSKVPENYQALHLSCTTEVRSGFTVDLFRHECSTRIR